MAYQSMQYTQVLSSMQETHQTIGAGEISSFLLLVIFIIILALCGCVMLTCRRWHVEVERLLEVERSLER